MRDLPVVGWLLITRVVPLPHPSLALGVAAGGFVELTFPEPAVYPFVSHTMVDAERGAHGTFQVNR